MVLVDKMVLAVEILSKAFLENGGTSPELLEEPQHDWVFITWFTISNFRKVGKLENKTKNIQIKS